MKRVVVITVVACLGIFSQGYCQQKVGGSIDIPSFSLTVCYNKTTNLIFPYAIRSVDRGSQDIIVQKAKGVDNVLQVKASREGFPETNISIITIDGKFYSFLVTYQEAPALLNLSFQGDSSRLTPACTQNGQPNAARLDSDGVAAMQEKDFMHLRRISGKLAVTLTGIYLKEHTMYLVIDIKNNTLVDWTGGPARLVVQNKHLPKRSAIQERQIVVLSRKDTIMVRGNDRKRMVVAIEPLTIDDRERVALRVTEMKGGRAVELHISSRRLLKARPIVNVPSAALNK